MSNFKEDFKVNIDESTATHAELQKELDRLSNLYSAEVEKLEQVMVDFALKHSLYLEIGTYGTGRTLIVKDEHWSGVSKGDWLPSSEAC